MRTPAWTLMTPFGDAFQRTEARPTYVRHSLPTKEKRIKYIARVIQGLLAAARMGTWLVFPEKLGRPNRPRVLQENAGSTSNLPSCKNREARTCRAHACGRIKPWRRALSSPQPFSSAHNAAAFMLAPGTAAQSKTAKRIASSMANDKTFMSCTEQDLCRAATQHQAARGLEIWCDPTGARDCLCPLRVRGSSEWLRCQGVGRPGSHRWRLKRSRMACRKHQSH